MIERTYLQFWCCSVALQLCGCLLSDGGSGGSDSQSSSDGSSGVLQDQLGNKKALNGNEDHQLAGVNRIQGLKFGSYRYAS